MDRQALTAEMAKFQELGDRKAWMEMLTLCLKHLSPKVWDETAWLLEREEAIMKLRAVCGQFGDNDWTPDLNLADIIEQHLARPLNEWAEGRNPSRSQQG